MQEYNLDAWEPEELDQWKAQDDATVAATKAKKSGYNRRQSAYSIHLELVPLPTPKPTRWEQPATALMHPVKIANRKADQIAANKIKGKAGGFLRQAAFKAFHNLNKIKGI